MNTKDENISQKKKLTCKHNSWTVENSIQNENLSGIRARN